MVGLGDGLGLLDFLTAGCLMSWKPLPRWAIFLLGVYLGAGVVTLSFQTWVRLHQCTGVGPCAISLGKGAVWSAIWPAAWPVYFAGYRRPGYPATAALWVMLRAGDYVALIIVAAVVVTKRRTSAIADTPAVEPVS